MQEMVPYARQDTLVQLESISKKYDLGEHVRYALKDVTIGIRGGELVVVLGPSGSGKTTMLNLIGGIDNPSAGTIKVNGIALNDCPDLTKFRRENIGFIFQFFNLIPTLTAQENVELVLELIKNGRSRKKLEKEALKHLDAVGLLDHANQFPAECSGGEQQRIAIARALAKRAPLILADEPTGELDIETGRMVLKLLRSLVDEGRSVILVTHNSEIAKIADRVIRLRGGEIDSIQDNSGSQLSVDELVW
ncbi:MAG: ABC transporter ATP-binding protein [Candidatus Thorarchaeota archaeon]